MTDQTTSRAEKAMWAGIAALAVLAFLGQLAGTGEARTAPATERPPGHPAPVEVAATDTDARLLPAPSPVDEDRFLVEAVVQVESGGRPDCVGLRGERGLMQIKAATWQEVTRNLFGNPYPFERAFEPSLNRRVGRAYLESMGRFVDRHQARWKGDRRSLVLACYNAGPGRVSRADFDLAGLPASTRDYVRRAGALHDALLSDHHLALRMAKADPASAGPTRRFGS